MVATTPITAEEFSKLPETNQYVELINGEIITEMPPIDEHQAVIVNLLVLLSRLIPDGLLRIAPLSVYLDEHNAPEPDLFWVSASNIRCKLGKDHQWHGAPDFIVEVLSPSTSLRDRRDKFLLYQKHGVREYWLVEPLAHTVEVWTMDKGQFVRQGLYGRAESFASAVIGGQIIDLETLFSD